jgi:hypothetical protein
MRIIDPRRIGFALGATLAALYLACAVMMAIFPRDVALTFANSITHGVDWRPIARWDQPWHCVLMGGVCVFIVGWLVGATFAAFYNLSGKTPSNEESPGHAKP